MNITIKITTKNLNIIKYYAKLKKQTINKFINEAIKSRIEDIYDEELCKKLLTKKRIKNAISFDDYMKGKRTCKKNKKIIP